MVGIGCKNSAEGIVHAGLEVDGQPKRAAASQENLIDETRQAGIAMGNDGRRLRTTGRRRLAISSGPGVIADSLCTQYGDGVYRATLPIILHPGGMSSAPRAQ